MSGGGPGAGAPRDGLPSGAKPSARPCPICGRPADPASLPFCSPRCARVDLNRWLSDVYRIPGDETADAEGEAAGERHDG